MDMGGLRWQPWSAVEEAGVVTKNIILEASEFGQTICQSGFLVGRSSVSRTAKSWEGYLPTQFYFEKRVPPQIGTCDTAVRVENQPEVTREKTQLQIHKEFSVSCHTSQIIFSAHSWEVWGNKLSALSFPEQMPGAGPSDVCFKAAVRMGVGSPWAS